MNNVVCSLLLCFLTCHIFLCLCVCLVCSQQQIMRDRWMNVGYEEEELKPYIEPQPDYKDPRRTGTYGIFHPILISTVVRMLLSTLTTAHSLTTYCHSCINQKMIFFLSVCVQISCCRWDSPRRKSRTHWWTRSIMMWWLHTCCWIIGTLRFTALFFHSYTLYTFA